LGLGKNSKCFRQTTLTRGKRIKELIKRKSAGSRGARSGGEKMGGRQRAAPERDV